MNEREFEKTFKTYFAHMANIAYSVVKDQDTAKDIVQQVFAKLWDKKNKVFIESSLKSYLHRATINTALNHIDRQKKLVLTDNQVDTPHESSEKEKLKPEEINAAIKKSMEVLPAKCQTVFSLSRFSGLTNQEIADHLNISIKAVEKHIGKALKELRVSLKPLMEALVIIIIIAWHFFNSQGRV